MMRNSIGSQPEEEGIKSSREIPPNIHQKDGDGEQEMPSVRVESESLEDLPETITRLGKEKVKFLIKGFENIPQGSKVLEAFGGSNLSTSLIGEQVGQKNLTSLDLHYSLSERADWKFDVSHNYPSTAEALEINNICFPAFITADAAEITLRERSFDFVIAPDPPRTLTQSREEKPSSSYEYEMYDKNGDNKQTSELTEEYKQLFLESVEEIKRILKYEGTLLTTVPLSWARELRRKDFAEVQIYSHQDLGGDVTELNIGRNLQFKTRGVDDPVVYVKCVK